MTADVIPFPEGRPTVYAAQVALGRFLRVSTTLLKAHGVDTPADLPRGSRQMLDGLAQDVVDMLAVLGPVLPGVEVVDGQLTFVVPA